MLLLSLAQPGRQSLGFSSWYKDKVLLRSQTGIYLILLVGDGPVSLIPLPSFQEAQRESGMSRSLKPTNSMVILGYV